MEEEEVWDKSNYIQKIELLRLAGLVMNQQWVDLWDRVTVLEHSEPSESENS